MKIWNFLPGIMLSQIIVFNSFAVTSSAPALKAPLNNSTKITINPVLSWNSATGASTYTFQFSTNPDFDSTLTTEKKGLTTTNLTLYGLFNGVKYYWRVKTVYDINRVSGWSTVWNFTIRKATIIRANKVGPTDVGIWYLPYGKTGSDWGADAPFEPLCSDVAGDFRQYDLADPEVMDYHLKQIADAQIDFIIFDNTNGGFNTNGVYNSDLQTRGYVETSRLMCEKINKWNISHSWKMRYVQAIGVWQDTSGRYLKGLPGGVPGNFGDCINKQAEICWKKFHQDSTYGGTDNWYYLDGKPLLIVFGGWYPSNMSLWYAYSQSSGFASSFTNRFTIRFACNGEKGTYGWNAIGIGGENNKNNYGTVIDEEVELVQPGWSIRSKPNLKLLRNNGLFYSKNCWDRVLSNAKPAIVVIASFNDYWEKTAVWTAKSNDNCILPVCDTWLGADSIEHPDMYWNMTKKYITMLRNDTLILTSPPNPK